MSQIQQQLTAHASRSENFNSLHGQRPAGQEHRGPDRALNIPPSLDTGASSHRPNSNGSVSEIQNHSFPKPPGSAKFSSRSLFFAAQKAEEPPRSPREKLDDLLALEKSHVEMPNARRPLELTKERRLHSDSQSVANPARVQHPTRNMSSPTLSSGLIDSSTPSPAINTAEKIVDQPVTSSRKDSPESPGTPSNLASHGRKSSQDTLRVEPSEVANLISSAGSAEAAITRLIKEKHSASTQNSQLWRLVEKQRAMILGLNKDMDRVLKEKEKYKKQVRELKEIKENMAQVPSALQVNKKSGAKTSEPVVEPSSMKEAASSGLRDSATLPAQEPLRQRTVEEDSKAEENRKPLPSEPAFDGFDDEDQSMRFKPKEERNLAHIDTAAPHPGSIPSPLGSTSSPRGFAASRAAMSFHKKNKPSIGVDTEAEVKSPGRDDVVTPTRKPPPAPLALPSPNGTTSAPPTHLSSIDHPSSAYDDTIQPTSPDERGRRPTREADDKAREIVAAQEEEHRSRSKKDKKSKSAAPPPEKLPSDETASKESKQTAPKRAVPVAPPSNLAQLVQGDSMASVLSQAPPLKTHTNNQRFVSLPQPSPGLPTSPRPSDRPLNSPAPRLPRQGASLVQSPPLSSTANGFLGLPLSPRAPKQSFPLPPNTPMSMISPGLQKPGAAFQISSPLGNSFQSFQRTAPDVSNVLNTQYRSIYRGLVSEQYPSLLLPPNALPLISIKVSSSRMKPSRASFIAGKPKVPEDENVFTLGVFARSDGQELWRVEKDVTALPQLDHRLKQSATLNARLPERSLFSGHAPAKIDARRAAIDNYFEAVLDTEIDDKTALELCHFLSTDAIEPSAEVIPTSLGVDGAADVAVKPISAIKRKKEGYLTKRGKNFGGWKARYFVLDGPVFRYFEAPGGAHLGTIKLYGAQIGKQPPPSAGSELSTSRTDNDEDEYRHAFVIMEPKKRDSSRHLQHTLCAESDAERDAWVETLLQFVSTESSEEEERSETTSRDLNKSSGYQSMKTFVSDRKEVENRGTESPTISSYQDSDYSVKAFSYDQARQADPAIVSGKSIATREAKDDESPSPPLISRPMNGAKIHDAEAWKSKGAPTPTTKEHKKRNIFGFRGRSSSDLQISTPSLTSSFNESHGPVKPCFGVPLAEAAEFCPPRGINVYLPAVVYRSIEYLEAKDAASEEGIFRLSGSNTVIKALRDRFDTEGDVNILAEDKYFDVHAVASLLKLYLRELPVSILTRELHLDFVQVMHIGDQDQKGVALTDQQNASLKSKKILALNQLVHSLPKANFWLLRALSAFLLTIITASDTNKMTLRNVGIVFSPTLNIPNPVFSLFLTDFDRIFNEDPDPSAPSPIAASPTVPLTPEDIRSPRKQLFTELTTPSFNQTSFPGLPTSPRHAPNTNAPEPRSPNNFTGFMPMQRQANFANPYAAQYHQQGPPSPMTQASSQEFGSLNGALAPSAAPPATPKTKDPQARHSKAQRRESSMLGMGMGYGNNSIPIGGMKQGTIPEDP